MGLPALTGYTCRPGNHDPETGKPEVMKRLTVVLILVLLPALAAAGELFPGYIETGGYGSISGQGSQLGRSETGFLLGGGGGLLINDDITIGVHANLLINDIEYNTLADEDRFIEYTMLNLRLGYIFWPQSTVHASLTGEGGLGWIKLRNPDKGIDEVDSDSDTVFQGQPMLHVILNLTRTLRLSVGGGYRWVSGINTEDINDQDAEGAVGEVAISFGAF